MITLLYDLMKSKDPRKVHWIPSCTGTFGETKKILCSRPELCNLAFSRDFILKSDTSDMGLGAVLSQSCLGVAYPEIYLSSDLFPWKKNCCDGKGVSHYEIGDSDCTIPSLESLSLWLLIISLLGACRPRLPMPRSSTGVWFFNPTHS